MTREEAIAFLDAGATNAPPAAASGWVAPQPSPAPVPQQESLGQYWSRSPIVQDVGDAVGRGASIVNRGVRAAGQDLKTGWNVATYPVRAVAGEYNRAVVQPARELAEAGAGYVGRGVDAVQRGGEYLADQAYQGVVQPTADWWNRRVKPPPLATPKTKREYNALPKGAYYIDPESGKTYRKQ